MAKSEKAESAPEPGDIELMQRVGKGDIRAFETLIRRHQQSLLNFFFRMGAGSDAEDMVQDTFLRVFAYRERYKPTAKFTTFLYTIARHAWIDGLRKLKKKETIAERTAQEFPDRDDDSMKRVGMGLDVAAALECLSDKLRPVVVMSLFQGLRYEEIAGILDVPVGTIKSRMSLALAYLKEVFDDKSKDRR